ncbi:hypothetical protein MSG28_001251 [Choristoneura fumiferana]|uniref:Uncharacterized protein n=1 Tax=Choristoneura fumiferana TaxID=7141 RepID=A0ACC0K4S9_CHOFU|nr:hypothetical protein MSG28_001251 [Choristoneura fumiferana]
MDGEIVSPLRLEREDLDYKITNEASFQDDFMAISIQNGYPYLVMDIGDSAESAREPTRISSEKFVADDRWYQVIVDRVGRNVKLSIRESLDNGTEVTHPKEAVLPGQHTIFNLDRQKSKLYVGGVPSNAKLQGISFPAFVGQIEELMVGDTPVGLWNFEAAEKLKGARQRDKLITPSSGAQEYRFNGRAHVTMPARAYVQSQKNQVLLFFRTYAKKGLIYLLGDKQSFFSISMQDGKVYLQVSLGNPEDLVIIGTSKTYNDGKWHMLDAGRYFANCSLRVDNEINRAVSTSKQVEITALDDMNFGGNTKGIPQIFDKGFDGCMRQITVDGVDVDLSKDSIESIGVGDGCKYASLVSLTGTDSYLRYVDLTLDNLQLTLKFKTEQPDGLIFVYLNRMQTTAMQDSISLSIVNGKLVLMSPRDTLDTGMHTYNDSQWHVVTVTHGAALKMRVDDFDHYSSDTAPDPLHILEGVLLIGGTQPNYVATYKAGTKSAFRGCIADATINGRVLNLLEPVSRHGVTFGRCGETISGFNPGFLTMFSFTAKLVLTKRTFLDNHVWPDPVRGDVLPTPAPPDQDAEVVTKQPGPGRPLLDIASPIDLQLPRLEATGIHSETTTLTRGGQPSAADANARADDARAGAHDPLDPRDHAAHDPPPDPQPQPGCALAYDPQYSIGDPYEGYRFGTRNDSRMEYAKLPGRQSDGLDLTVTLRTFDRHGGLLFYASAATAPDQFLAIYMKDARLHFTFNCGGDTALVVSPDTYNDTEWHTVTVIRTSGHGKMTVDSDRVGEASVSCNNPAALAPPYYYGGLKSFAGKVSGHLSDFYQPFKGCLRGLMMNGQYVTEVLRRVNALRCTDNIEEGVYFGPSSNTSSNYLKS